MADGCTHDHRNDVSRPRLIWNRQRRAGQPMGPSRDSDSFGRCDGRATLDDAAHGPQSRCHSSIRWHKRLVFFSSVVVDRGFYRRLWQRVGCRLALVPMGLWAVWRVARQTSRQLVYLYLFYICCGLVVPAKGWLGWAPMGLAIVGYLLISGEWKRLAQVDIPTGLLIVAVTGHFWVVAMLAGTHPGWWDRFIIHDHYRRLFAGVHSIDSGGFEYSSAGLAMACSRGLVCSPWQS